MMHGLEADLLGKREAIRCGRCIHFIAGLANDRLSLVGTIFIKRGLVLKNGRDFRFGYLWELFFHCCLHEWYDDGRFGNL